MSESLEFVEIERKYLVGQDFDVDALARALAPRQPAVDKQISTRDVYFTTGVDGFIYRHRLDAEIQHLTVKSYGGSTLRRTEVNLALAGGDQLAAVRAFLGPLGIAREVQIDKQSRVFELADCEVVHYRATCGDRTVRCVEIEAVGAASEAAALAVIDDYERLVGLNGHPASDRNLFDLLAAPA